MKTINVLDVAIVCVCISMVGADTSAGTELHPRKIFHSGRRSTWRNQAPILGDDGYTTHRQRKRAATLNKKMDLAAKLLANQRAVKIEDPEPMDLMELLSPSRPVDDFNQTSHGFGLRWRRMKTRLINMQKAMATKKIEYSNIESRVRQILQEGDRLSSAISERQALGVKNVKLQTQYLEQIRHDGEEFQQKISRLMENRAKLEEQVESSAIEGTLNDVEHNLASKEQAMLGVDQAMERIEAKSMYPVHDINPGLKIEDLVEEDSPDYDEDDHDDHALDPVENGDMVRVDLMLNKILNKEKRHSAPLKRLKRDDSALGAEDTGDESDSVATNAPGEQLHQDGARSSQENLEEKSEEKEQEANEDSDTAKLNSHAVDQKMSESTTDDDAGDERPDGDNEKAEKAEKSDADKGENEAEEKSGNDVRDDEGAEKKDGHNTEGEDEERGNESKKERSDWEAGHDEKNESVGEAADAKSEDTNGKSGDETQESDEDDDISDDTNGEKDEEKSGSEERDGGQRTFMNAADKLKYAYRPFLYSFNARYKKAETMLNQIKSNQMKKKASEMERAIKRIEKCINATIGDMNNMASLRKNEVREQEAVREENWKNTQKLFDTLTQGLTADIERLRTLQNEHAGDDTDYESSQIRNAVQDLNTFDYHY